MKALTSQKIHFTAQDGLRVTGDVYVVNRPKGFFVLCHRSHFNRGEYTETAGKLVELGYSCLAIDQRSGMNVLGVQNETYNLAKQKKLPTGYRDARPDIEAAIEYTYNKNCNKPIILVGSSYSASLALLIAVDNPKVKAVIAYSPGEYLKGIPVTETIKGIIKPTYVTCAKNEIAATRKLLKCVKPKYLTFFTPQGEGAHGSRVLWEKTPGNEEYWESLCAFLEKIHV